MRLKLLAVGLAPLLVVAPAKAAEVIGGGGCATDLTFLGGSTLINCYGRFSGNVLNNSSNTEINAALDALGYAGPDLTYSLIPAGQKISVGTDVGSPVNFPGVLNGLAYIGIHVGGGGKTGVGNSTTFYKINAVNLDVFTLNPSGGSGATLFVTAPAAAVPEPTTWAMMILGFGAIGTSLRRRQQVRVTFA